MKKIIILFLILVLFACRSPLNVVPINNINHPANQGLFYILPKTEIIIEVDVAKIIKNRGPYADYTEKYLGQLTNVIHKNETYWEISNIEFHTVALPDSSQIFFIESKAPSPLSITKQGFPLSYNCKTEYKPTKFQYSKNSASTTAGIGNDFFIADKSYKVVYDTIYKIETYDTIIRKIPVLKPNLVQKTTEEQAKELADKISTLTDDRAALLVGEGDNDYLPEGDALRIMLDEIDKLLNSYLIMFKGKSDTLKYKYYFTYIPDDYYSLQEITLFKFSPKSGILSADNLFGTDVEVRLSAISTNQDLNTFIVNSFSSKDSETGLYYRIPQLMKIQLVKDKQVLSEDMIFVCQTGNVYSLPSKYFKNKNLKIEFYPDLGAIKNISY